MVGQLEYATPIPDRKDSTDWVRTIVFSLWFNYVIIVTNLTQFVALAFLYPWQATRPYYERYISYTKLIFGRLIVTLSQLFAPTKLIVSCSDENGNYLDPEKFVRRNSQNRIVEVLLPERSIWISNHQVYTDWLYIW
jgi:lysocardiolipin and lysophospholipid acyltransferase